MSPLGAGRYGWFVVIVGVALVVYVAINGAGADGPGTRGIRTGDRMPPFAAPLATAGLDCDEDSDPCDANISRREDGGDAGTHPACRVRGRAILNVCDLYARSPVVLAFVGTDSAGCADDIDALATIERRHPGVRVAAVGVLGDYDTLAGRAREHGWRFPVGWDRDGAVTSLYGVVTCPQIVFSRPRGLVLETTYRALGARRLETKVTELETASRRVGWRPPRR